MGKELTLIPLIIGLPSWTTLEKLPYLSAVIQEGLRLSLGVSSRTARIPTEEILIYQGKWKGSTIQYLLPKGYAIGMSSAITHYDEKIFAEPTMFKPERWLDTEQRKELDRGMLVFSKGSRACLGMKYVYPTLDSIDLRIYWNGLELMMLSASPFVNYAML